MFVFVELDLGERPVQRAGSHACVGREGLHMRRANENGPRPGRRSRTRTADRRVPTHGCEAVQARRTFVCPTRRPFLYLVSATRLSAYRYPRCAAAFVASLTPTTERHRFTQAARPS